MGLLEFLDVRELTLREIAAAGVLLGGFIAMGIILGAKLLKYFSHI